MNKRCATKGVLDGFDLVLRCPASAEFGIRTGDYMGHEVCEFHARAIFLESPCVIVSLDTNRLEAGPCIQFRHLDPREPPCGNYAAFSVYEETDGGYFDALTCHDHLAAVVIEHVDTSVRVLKFPP